MFTGLILSKAKILNFTKKNGEAKISIEPEISIKDYQIGESIAVNGVCLTLESFFDNIFSVYASEETLQKTTMQNLAINNIVNIERALTLSSRLGGHFVSGHIDGIGRITHINNVQSSKKIKINVTKDIIKFIAEKASVAIDGISLTINNVYADSFEVNLIPETLNKTNADSWKVCDNVNLEADILAKYVNSCLNKCESKINTEFLKRKWFYVV
jgi:riboflavin synthase